MCVVAAENRFSKVIALGKLVFPTAIILKNATGTWVPVRLSAKRSGLPPIRGKAASVPHTYHYHAQAIA